MVNGRWTTGRNTDFTPMGNLGLARTLTEYHPCFTTQPLANHLQPSLLTYLHTHLPIACLIPLLLPHRVSVPTNTVVGLVLQATLYLRHI